MRNRYVFLFYVAQTTGAIANHDSAKCRAYFILSSKRSWKSYALIISHLISGLGIIALLQHRTWHGLNPSILILVAFILVNTAHVFLFNLREDAASFWSPRKLIYLPAGIAGGLCIAAIPVVLALLFSDLSVREITLHKNVSMSSLSLTFIIVSWEELWFRGIVLNYCRRHLSEITIAIVMGALFMLVHFLNPEINLLEAGPTLFFAGALLTISYFYFKTIWLPLGLHFGNNYFSSLISSKIEPDPIFGSGGYVNLIILAIVFLILSILNVRRQKKTASGVRPISLVA